MKIFLVIAYGLALAGCAAGDTPGLGDCADVNWYSYGLRDGSESGRSNLQRYNEACAALSAKPDAAQYEKGLAEGLRIKARDRRF